MTERVTESNPQCAMLELLELAPPALLARKQARAPQISRSARDGDCMLRVFRTKKKILGD
jgi:hypothetical protein